MNLLGPLADRVARSAQQFGLVVRERPKTLLSHLRYCFITCIYLEWNGMDGEWMLRTYIYTSIYGWISHTLVGPTESYMAKIGMHLRPISPVLVSWFILIGGERVRISVFRLFGEI